MGRYRASVWRRARLASCLVALAMLGPACGGDGSGDQGGGTLVFAQLGEPATLDPALQGRIPQFVVTHQLFETLVKVKPGGTEIVPGLARSWSPGHDGSSWTFRLQPGVRFHDGTAFDAEAVCTNFERWYHFRGFLRSPNVSGAWQDSFGGFAASEGEAPSKPSLYRSCEARTDDEVVVNLTRRAGTFLTSLALPSFAMASPAALARYEADKVGGSPEQPVFDSTFGTEHPVGTGPFRFESWRRTERITLVRNDAYWAEKPYLRRLVIRGINDAAARRQALQSGEVQGFFPVDAGDLDSLRRQGFQVFEQPALNVAILAFNQTKPPLDNLTVRQAVAHAVDRATFVRAKYSATAEVADQFTPPSLWGRATSVPRYTHDPDRARELVAQSGVSRPALEVTYPTGDIGPALPDGEGAFLQLKADLEAVGFRVEGSALPVAQYSLAVNRGDAQMWFTTRYALRVDPDFMLSGFTSGPPFGLDDARLFGLLEQARSEVDQKRREQLYEEVNRLLVELLPALPIVHVKPAIVFSPRVKGYRVSVVPWDLGLLRLE